MGDYSFSRLDGNREFTRRQLSELLTVHVPAGEMIYLRWVLIGDGGMKFPEN